MFITLRRGLCTQGWEVRLSFVLSSSIICSPMSRVCVCVYVSLYVCECACVRVLKCVCMCVCASGCVRTHAHD